ncbi:4-(cytidine 5'-diphospho)-2-C-methyl-D-erythritol kinase [Kaistia algarum]|uniref:4-(cytidine 5'-diphospho)-2-C-methyl-D-erythritol kinase n=1 Tax=Kaistia algarum TaxID=2083279 RepID=UPI000CE831EB|nr:4-(cytidine 5'-diphospho)-2-C-methyl-D-erythritol kinase [Kaistia algarum]MCX5512336.1 4-(cytidine 5'-diphospho)-2-C-methyl-D-erythritol kinase [Kaistia algarum]PPE80423.1 4-(cytidine 5'-diphospho)-2-C-methyl-D-erythritol kinase [Kaistia algarum]
MTTAAGGTLAETARAKINLALHVVGRRADDYHELDSLVVFAAIGDTLEIARAAPGTGRLIIDGPFAAGLGAGDDNLVLKAMAAFEADIAPLPVLALHLTKRLPIASGIGGGSADAAATLRLAARHAGIAADDPRLPALATRLGADVPMCLASRPLRAQGIGERLTPWTEAPRLSLLLVNPGVGVSTPAIFRRLERRDRTPLPELPPAPSMAELAAWLAEATRNDLQEPAIAEAPMIAEALREVESCAGCRLARMSGSGATVFGLFANDAAAEAAARAIGSAHPSWWVVATSAEASPAAD